MTKQTKQVELPEMIGEYRKHLGLTQVEFTRSYGMKSTILGSLWESGKREAPFVVMQEVINWKLAQAQQEAIRVVKGMKRNCHKNNNQRGCVDCVLSNKRNSILEEVIQTLQKEQE